MERNTIVMNQAVFSNLITDDMNLEDLLSVGFKKQSHFIAPDAVVYKLSRSRHLCLANMGTTEEELWICESDQQDEKKIIDMVSLHCYEHDGHIDLQKINGFISLMH